MHDVDVLARDQGGEAAHVGGHRHRVFTGGRKGVKLAAERLQFADEPPAFGRDQRARAGLHQGFGDFQRRALRASRIEIGDDLEDGLADDRTVDVKETRILRHRR